MCGVTLSNLQFAQQNNGVGFWNSTTMLRYCNKSYATPTSYNEQCCGCTDVKVVVIIPHHSMAVVSKTTHA